MDELRRPFFFSALILMVVVLLLEMGAAELLEGASPQLSAISQSLPEGELAEAFAELDDEQREKLTALSNQDKPPGLAIPYLALLDGVLLFTIALFAVSLVIGAKRQGRVQGPATLVFSLLLILSAIGMILSAIASVTLMISLFLSVPFGTLAYLAGHGFFNSTGATIALSLLMSLKVAFVICLLLAQQGFLQNKPFFLLIITSFASQLIISFLHALVPTILVSITDGIAAIIVAILAVLWGIFLLVGSFSSIVKKLRSKQPST